MQRFNKYLVSIKCPARLDSERDQDVRDLNVNFSNYKEIPKCANAGCERQSTHLTSDVGNEAYRCSDHVTSFVISKGTLPRDYWFSLPFSDIIEIDNISLPHDKFTFTKEEAEEIFEELHKRFSQEEYEKNKGQVIVWLVTIGGCYCCGLKADHEALGLTEYMEKHIKGQPDYSNIGQEIETHWKTGRSRVLFFNEERKCLYAAYHSRKM